MTRRLDGELVVMRAFGVPDFLTVDAVRWEVATVGLVEAVAESRVAEVGSGPFTGEMGLLKALSGLVSKGRLDQMHPKLGSDTAKDKVLEELVPFGRADSQKMKMIGSVAVDEVLKYLCALDRELDGVSLFTDDPVPE